MISNDPGRIPFVTDKPYTTNKISPRGIAGAGHARDLASIIEVSRAWPAPTNRDGSFIYYITGFIIFFLSTISLFNPPNASASDWSGNISPFIGFFVLDNEEWRDTFTSGEIGFMVDAKKKTWPVSIACDVLYSKGIQDFYAGAGGIITPAGFGYHYVPEGYYGEYEARTYEIHLGPRFIWEKHPGVRPFLGGGVLMSHVEGIVSYSLEKVVYDGSGVGYWISGGNFFRLSPHFNIGVEYRYCRVNVEMSPGNTINAGGEHIRCIFGYVW